MQRPLGTDATSNWARIYLSHGTERTYLRMGAVPKDEASTRISTVASLTLPETSGVLAYTEGAPSSGTAGDKTEVLGADSVEVLAGKRRTVVGGDASVADQSMTIDPSAPGDTHVVLAGGLEETVRGGHTQTVSNGDQTITVMEGDQRIKSLSGTQTFSSGGAQTITVVAGDQYVTAHGDHTMSSHGELNLTVGGKQHWHAASLGVGGGNGMVTSVKGLLLDVSYIHKFEIAGIFAIRVAPMAVDSSLVRSLYTTFCVSAYALRYDLHKYWTIKRFLEVGVYDTSVESGSSTIFTST